jgi:hypothetical protein
VNTEVTDKTPTTAEILDKAADVIDQRGWVSDDYVSPGGAVCARVALTVTVGQDPMFAVEWPSYCKVVSFDDDGYGTDAERATHANITAAEAAFAEHIRGLFDDGSDDATLIERWNDGYADTAEQVTTTMRECAAELAGSAK